MESTGERRKHLRYTYLANTEYMLEPSTSGQICECAVINVSDTGVNLLISKPLETGQTIAIRGDLPNLARTAVVRWTRKLDGFYSAGLECNYPEKELGGEGLAVVPIS